MTYAEVLQEQSRQNYMRETLDESRRTWSENFRLIVARSFRRTSFDGVSSFSILMPGCDGQCRANAEYQIQREAEIEGCGAVWLVPCADGRFDIGYRPLWPLSEAQEQALKETLPAFLTRCDQLGAWRVEGLSRSDALFLVQDLAGFAWLCDYAARGEEGPREEWSASLSRCLNEQLFAF